MEKEFDNTNRGAIWRNDKKTTEKHPDVTGSINVEGVDYWLSGWTKAQDASAKAPIMKFAITKKEQQVRQKPQESYANEPEQGPKPVTDFMDDIPF